MSREALGHFDGGEVSAARPWCPLTDVVEAFGPLARKGALGDKLVCEAAIAVGTSMKSSGPSVYPVDWLS
jgi:hypothetical protein